MQFRLQNEKAQLDKYFYYKKFVGLLSKKRGPKQTHLTAIDQLIFGFGKNNNKKKSTL